VTHDDATRRPRSPARRRQCIRPSRGIRRFNNATGINGDGLVNNSPYNVANAPLSGQGAGEPGWFTPWQGGGPTVVNTTTFEGDGAVFMQGTQQPVRVLASPVVSRMSVEVRFRIVNSAVSGNGINFYVRQDSAPVFQGIGPQWQMRNTGQITVQDGNEDGDPSGTLHVLPTGMTWTPGVWHTARMDIDMVARRWDFAYDGVTFNPGHRLGFRGSPVFLDRIDYLNEINAPNGSFMDALTVSVTPVPEPSSLALAGVALSGAAHRRWRRRLGR
jgi:hypothetical protein